MPILEGHFGSFERVGKLRGVEQFLDLLLILLPKGSFDDPLEKGGSSCQKRLGLCKDYSSIFS